MGRVAEVVFAVARRERPWQVEEDRTDGALGARGTEVMFPTTKLEAAAFIAQYCVMACIAVGVTRDETDSASPMLLGVIGAFWPVVAIVYAVCLLVRGRW